MMPDVVVQVTGKEVDVRGWKLVRGWKGLNAEARQAAVVMTRAAHDGADADRRGEATALDLTLRDCGHGHVCSGAGCAKKSL